MIWALAGIVIALVVRLLIKPSSQRHPVGEWLTPLLAGIVVATAVRLFDSIGRNGLLSPTTMIGFGLFVAAVIAFGLRSRTARASSFSFAPIRGALMRVLLVGVALVALVGTLTYVILALEYMYGMTALEAAIAVIPAQVGAVIGAKVLGGRAIRRWGMARAGRHLTLALAVSVLPLVAMQASTPVWYLLLCATAFNTAALAAITVLNTHVMSRAPAESTGPVSSFRGAASSIGTGLGVVVLGTSVITATSMSSGSASVTAAQVEQIAAGLRLDGVLGCAVALTAWIALTVVERSRAGDGTQAVPA